MTNTTNERAEIIAALYAWIAQRPGLDPRNYISHGRDDAGRAAYRSEVRSITKDLNQAHTLLRYVELHQSITGDMLKAAFPRAFSGRLSWVTGNPPIPAYNGTKPYLSYTTGQYWPTEYRAAACAVLASAIWYFWRDQCLPEPQFRDSGDDFGPEMIYGKDKLSCGDYLRRMARNEFGRGIASRWFN